jgi:hypothetical protein
LKRKIFFYLLCIKRFRQADDYKIEPEIEWLNKMATIQKMNSSLSGNLLVKVFECLGFLNVHCTVNIWADMQRHKINLEVQTCSYFSQLKIKIDLNQELNIPAQNTELLGNDPNI